MPSINVNDVSKAYGKKRLFQEVSVEFTEGKRYGLTGPNGAGKSTFLKIVSGELEPDSGHVHKPERTGVLKQDQFGFEKMIVLSVVLMGNHRLWAAMQEKEELLAKETLTDKQGELLGELEGVIAEEDGYSAESDAAELLAGLGIPESEHEKQMRELPGGFKLRVLLAQALFGNPDALLLDEPTNNLDIDSIRWLEKFLCNYRGVLITISHDRHFLNEICTHIADIDYETIITYPGGYDDMIIAKGQSARQSRARELGAAKEGRAAARLRGPLRRRHARDAGSKQEEANRAFAAHGLEALQHRAPVHSILGQKAVRQANRDDRKPDQALARRHRVQQLLDHRHQGREDRHHWQERHGQDHAV